MLKKSHYGSHAIDPIFHPMKMVITRILKCYRADLHATNNLIALYIHDIISLHMTCNMVSSYLPYNATHQLRGTSERSDVNKIGHSKCLGHVI